MAAAKKRKDTAWKAGNEKGQAIAELAKFARSLGASRHSDNVNFAYRAASTSLRERAGRDGVGMQQNAGRPLFDGFFAARHEGAHPPLMDLFQRSRSGFGASGSFGFCDFCPGRFQGSLAPLVGAGSFLLS